MEWQLSAGPSERQIAEFVEYDEVEAGQVVRDATLASGAGFGLELVDEIECTNCSGMPRAQRVGATLTAGTQSSAKSCSCPLDPLTWIPTGLPQSVGNMLRL